MAFTPEQIECIEMQDGGWRPTDQRPGPLEIARIIKALRKEREKQFPHKPGDGWHYLPGLPVFVLNGGAWFGAYDTSEGAVLAHVADICALAGIDFATLYQRAYAGDQDVPAITPAEHATCARPATLADIPLVMRDLVAINYSALRNAFAEALRLRGLWQQEEVNMSKQTKPKRLALDVRYVEDQYTRRIEVRVPGAINPVVGSIERVMADDPWGQPRVAWASYGSASPEFARTYALAIETAAAYVYAQAALLGLGESSDA